MIESYLHDQAVLYKSMEVHLCRYVSVARYCSTVARYYRETRRRKDGT